MMGSYTNEWIKLDWKQPKKLKNKTDFKNKVTQHLLTLRQEKSLASLPPDYRHFLAGHDANQSCYFYSQELFERYALDHYKVDAEYLAGKNKPQPNDIIRLFGISALEDNIDMLLSLGHGKSFDRKQQDGTYLHFYLPFSYTKDSLLT